ncbi:MAG: substrate-binding domain-containing protein, partial [bacterium]|nr:substrate-binding domain-containing protein [bacterium]
YVSIGRISNNQKGSFVDTDNIKRTYIAVEHFITEHRFKRIGYIGIRPIYSVYADTLEGYRSCLKRYGIEEDREIIYLAKDEDAEEGYKGAKKVLSGSPECIVVMGNIVLNGVLRYIAEQKIDIPEDIPIIHCSELPLVLPPDIQLTQVRQPVFELGRYAIDILLRQIQKKGKREQVVLNPEFYAGSSCGCKLRGGER